jgi:hypothetical protein
MVAGIEWISIYLFERFWDRGPGRQFSPIRTSSVRPAVGAGNHPVHENFVRFAAAFLRGHLLFAQSAT